VSRTDVGGEHTWALCLSSVPDLLGHGESAKPRADYAIAAYACGMRDLLGVLDVDRVSVVGHSLGGGIAMQFAYQFPERCERLVLVGSGGIGQEVHPLLRMAAVPGAELGLSVAAPAPVRAAVRLAAPVLRSAGGMPFGPDFGYVLDRYRALRPRSARQAFLRTLRSVGPLPPSRRQIGGHGPAPVQRRLNTSRRAVTDVTGRSG
jgi:pimeloyl-ACP methyl ester carboxylesterase